MIIQILSALIILGIAILFLNPGHLSMPKSLNSMLIILLIVSFLTYAGFILKEESKDEREKLHALFAGRISYLVGIGGLAVALIFQTLNHKIDPWIVIILCAMVFAKIASRIYSGIKK